jgi:hypothetical protein
MPQGKHWRIPRIPKKVQKAPLLKRKISILPEQVRSTIDSDPLNLFAFCSDRKNYTLKPDCSRAR